jgi:hypothetical protein
MLLALQDRGLAGKVTFVGFDSSPQFVDAMRNDQMQGIVVQSPFAIGELGVKSMVDSLLGKPVEKRIDTGVMIHHSRENEFGGGPETTQSAGLTLYELYEQSRDRNRRNKKGSAKGWDTRLC